MTYEELKNHSFSQSVFNSFREILKNNESFIFARGAEHYLDEHELYIIRVGNRLSLLLAHCEQLNHTIIYISNFRITPSMARAGINRAKYLKFSTENYIIRTQILYDLVLKLVNAVFNLANAENQCRHETIVQNLKVKHTKIPNELKPLRKKLTEFNTSRHAIIHGGNYQEDDIFNLELFSETEAIYRISGEQLPENLSFLPDAVDEITKEIVNNRKKQYTRFNSNIIKLIHNVFSVLQDVFENEEQKLRLISGKGI